MTENLDDVWTTRDYPVLCDFARRIDAGESIVTAEAIATSCNVDEDHARLALAALVRRGLVTKPIQVMDNRPGLMGACDISVTPTCSPASTPAATTPSPDSSTHCARPRSSSTTQTRRAASEDSQTARSGSPATSSEAS
jgi:hypothetical protein